MKSIMILCFLLFFSLNVFSQLIVPPAEVREEYVVGEIIDLSTEVWNETGEEKSVTVIQELFFIDLDKSVGPFETMLVLAPNEMKEVENLSFIVTENTYPGNYYYRIELLEGEKQLSEIRYDFKIINNKTENEIAEPAEEPKKHYTIMTVKCNMDGECNEWETIENCPTDCTKEDIKKRETREEGTLFQEMDLQTIMTIIAIIVIAIAIGFWYYSKKKERK